MGEMLNNVNLSIMTLLENFDVDVYDICNLRIFYAWLSRGMLLLVSCVPMREKKTTRKGLFLKLNSAQRCHHFRFERYM